MSASFLWPVALVLLGAVPAAGDYFAPADPKAGGIRDLMLIYLSKDSWSQHDFLPYVAYLGKESPPRPRDWFYDSFLFLAYGGAPSGTTYIDGPSNKADWEYYLDQLLFREGRSLAALEACIADVEQTLGRRPAEPRTANPPAVEDGTLHTSPKRERGNASRPSLARRASVGADPPRPTNGRPEDRKPVSPGPFSANADVRKVPVILMIPYPSRAQQNLGDVDGDGRSEDLSQAADRQKVVGWCVGEMLRRWKKTRFPHLTLWGFYWMNEGRGPHDEAIVRATADDVHGQGYGLHWIPYYRAPGCDKLSELGIDFAVLQPNYAFMEQSGRRAEEQRLSDTARLARRWHMGIEIEMAAIGGRRERDNLWDYLAHGRDQLDGYMRHAVHAYYQG